MNYQIGVAAGFALLAIGEFLAPVPAPPEAVAGGMVATAPVTVAATAQGQAADWSQTMLARPLFRQDRRPLAAAVVADDAPVPLPRLSAIIVTTFGAAAIFDDGSGKPLVLRAGGAVAGYTIKRVGPDSVLLVSATGNKTLRPQFGPGGAPADPATADNAAPASIAANPANPALWRRNLDNE
jgi:hypothetical protein